MKRSFIFVFLVSMFFAFNANAQHEEISSEKKTQISVGFLLNPQGEISFKDVNLGFKGSVPLLAVITFSKGSWSATPVYNIMGNSYGAFVKKEFTPMGIYLVALKDMNTSNLYAGLGFDVEVAKGIASVFVESGIKTGWEESEFCITVGACIPLKLVLFDSKK